MRKFEEDYPVDLQEKNQLAYLMTLRSKVRALEDTLHQSWPYKMPPYAVQHLRRIESLVATMETELEFAKYAIKGER